MIFVHVDLLLDDPEKSLGWNLRGKEDDSDSFTDALQFEKIPFPLALHVWNGRTGKGMDLLAKTLLCRFCSLCLSVLQSKCQYFNMHTLTLMMQMVLCCSSPKKLQPFPREAGSWGVGWFLSGKGAWVLTECSKTGLARCWCGQENLFCCSH